MRSLALDGKCVIQLDLGDRADPQVVRSLVQNRVRLAKTDLPPRCATEVLSPTDGSFTLLALQPTDDMTLDQASIWAKKLVRPLLAGVPGVAQIHILGAIDEPLRITLDPDRLRVYNLAAGDVAAAIQASRKDFDGLSMHGIKMSVNEKDVARNLGNISLVPGKDIYLRDVASVKSVDDPSQDARILRRSGKGPIIRRAVFFLVELMPGKNNPLAKQELEKAVTKVRDILPKGMRLEARTLQAEDTTVVVRLPDDLGSDGRQEKALAAAKAMMELSQVDTMFTIARLETGELLAFVFADAGKPAELRQSLRARLAKIEGTTTRVGGLISPMFSWPGQGAKFVVRLHGSDRDKLRKTAELLRRRLAKTPGLVDVDLSPRLRHELAIEIDRERMALVGVQPADLVKAMGPQDQPVFGWPFPITVTVPHPVSSKSPKKIADEMGLLPVRTEEGRPAVLLRDVARIQTITAPAAILHEGGAPCVTVFGNLDGRTPQDARADIRRIATELAGEGIVVVVE